MCKVFVTSENVGLDYSPAEGWGELQFITNKDFTAMGELSPSNADLVREIRKQLLKFNAEEDLVIVSGSPLVSAVVFMMLGKMGVKRISVLRWSNRDHVYYRTSVNIEV